jgi:molybdopterin molybdotransferase
LFTSFDFGRSHLVSGFSVSLAMLRIEDAQALILNNLPNLEDELVALDQAHGRVLRDIITSDIDLPPFDRARMDGYAVRSSDTTNGSPQSTVVLRSIGEAAAGRSFDGIVQPGTAVRIMTGAPVPEGADAVEKIEVINLLDDGQVVLDRPVKPGQFVTPRASEAAKGEVMVEAGQRVTPGISAVLASFGYNQIRVARRPRIALLSTGSELVDVGTKPGPSQIRNSNVYSLGGYSIGAGAEVVSSGVVLDDIEATCRAIQANADIADVVLLSGGVSMGDYDLVKPALGKLGATVFVERVAMHPGKPTVFARLGDKVIFGLPGNPVSVAVAFHIFARPALLQMQGASEIHPPKIRGRVTRDVKGAPPRRSHQPGRLKLEGAQVWVEPLKWGGSSDLVAFMKADSLIVVPEDVDRIASGEIADVISLT